MTAAPLPRKRRTREHVIADLSFNHVERYILEAGFTCLREVSDYGYDLVRTTFDENGYVEPGLVYFQLKASESLTEQGNGYPFDIDIRDYNRWVFEAVPVILVLYDASRRKGYWVCVQDYFRQTGQQPRPGAKTVRLLVPRRQPVTRRAIVTTRSLKARQEWAILGEEA
jgi:hypothetical protein